MKSAGASSYGEFLKKLARQMLAVYHSFSDLGLQDTSPEVAEDYRMMIEDLNAIVRRGVPVTSDIDAASSMVETLQYSLFNLTRLIAVAPNGQKSVIIVDEYDAPVDQAFSAQSGKFHKRL